MSHTEERLLDENTIKEEIEKTYEEICDLFQDIQHKEGVLREKIRYVAGLCEKLLVGRGFPDQVSEISTQIIRRLDKLVPGASEYVPHTLDSKYKRVKSEESTSHLLSSDSDVPEECSIISDEYKEHADALLDSKPGYLTRDALRELYFKSISAADKFKGLCENNNIALPTKGDHFGDYSDDDKDEKVQQEKPVIEINDPNEIAVIPLLKTTTAGTIERPKVIQGSIKAIDKIIQDLHAFRQALIDYPFDQNDPLATETEIAFDSFHEVLQHSSDKKYRRTLLQWNDILYEAGEQGGTSAASHSGVACAGLTDQKTGRPLFRNITKEQIDAIKLPMYQKMNRIIHGLPVLGKIFVSMDEHFRKYEAPWRERRCALLSPKLQKKA